MQWLNPAAKLLSSSSCLSARIFTLLVASMTQLYIRRKVPAPSNAIALTLHLHRFHAARFRQPKLLAALLLGPEHWLDLGVTSRINFGDGLGPRGLGELACGDWRHASNCLLWHVSFPSISAGHTVRLASVACRPGQQRRTPSPLASVSRAWICLQPLRASPCAAVETPSGSSVFLGQFSSFDPATALCQPFRHQDRKRLPGRISS